MSVQTHPALRDLAEWFQELPMDCVATEAGIVLTPVRNSSPTHLRSSWNGCCRTGARTRHDLAGSLSHGMLPPLPELAVTQQSLEKLQLVRMGAAEHNR